MIQDKLSDFIYFAKPEELALVEFDKDTTVELSSEHGFHFKSIVVDGDLIHLVSGEKQGQEFIYRFCQFLTLFKVNRIIMCGICASDSEKAKGTVVVSTNSRLFTGKMNNLDISSVSLENISESNIADLSNLQINLGNTHKWKDVEFISIFGGYLQVPFVINFHMTNLLDRIKETDRTLVSVEMESWFFLNATRNAFGRSFPVIKSIVDFGKDPSGLPKDDKSHRVGVNNSLIVGFKAMKLLSQSVKPEEVKRVDSALVVVSQSGKRQLEVEEVEKEVKRSKKAKSISIGKIKEVIQNEGDIELISLKLEVKKYKPLSNKVLEDLKGRISVETYRKLKSILN